MAETVESRQKAARATPRDRAWQSCRILRQFTLREVQAASDISFYQAQRYVREFADAGAIQRQSNAKPYRYRLVRNQVRAPGAETRAERIAKAKGGAA